MIVALLLLLPPPQLNRLGADAFARGDYAAARDGFRLAWHKERHANTASNLAAAAKRLGELDDAERWFTVVIEMRRAGLGEAHPDTVIAWNNRGETRFQQGRMEDARRDLEKARSMVKKGSGDEAVVLHNLGSVHRREGRLQEAQRALEAALVIRPGDGRTRALLGEVLLDRARPRDALRHCLMALREDPEAAGGRRCVERVRTLVLDAGDAGLSGR